LNIEPVAGAGQSHREHSGSMDDFHGSINGEERDGLAAGMLFLPRSDRGEGEILEEVR